MPLGEQLRAHEYIRGQQVYYKGDDGGWCGGEVIGSRGAYVQVFDRLRMRHLWLPASRVWPLVKRAAGNDAER